MEGITQADKPPLPTPNLCRLVEILFKNARRRKQLSAQETNEERNGHDVEKTCPLFKGKTPSEVSLTELTAEFRALTVTQEQESRRQFEKVETTTAPSQWRQLKAGDAEFLALAPFRIEMKPCEEFGADDNRPTADRKPVLPDVTTPPNLLMGHGAANAVSSEEIIHQQGILHQQTGTSAHGPGGSTQQLSCGVSGSEVGKNTASFMGRPLYKTSGVSTSSNPSVQMTRLMWVRLASNQLVLAQVPVAGTGQSGIAAPVQAHMGAPPPLSASPYPGKAGWAALAAVSPQEHKQMLGERLYPLVQQRFPGLAQKITGMLLELESSEVLKVLETPEALKNRVEEAVNILQHRLVVSQQPLSAEVLDPFPSQQQKQIVGERLFSRLQTLCPDQAGKITGMLLTLDNPEVLRLLDDPALLESRVDEAVTLLRRFREQKHSAGEEIQGKQSPVGNPSGLQPQAEEFLGTQTQLLTKNLSGTLPLNGRPSGTPLRSGDHLTTETLTEILSGKKLPAGDQSGITQPLTKNIAGKEFGAEYGHGSVSSREDFLGKETPSADMTQKEPLTGSSLETPSQPRGVAGAESFHTDILRKLFSPATDGKDQSTANNISVPLSMTGDVMGKHADPFAEGITGKKSVVQNISGNWLSAEDTFQPNSPSGGVTETKSLMGNISATQWRSDTCQEAQRPTADTLLGTVSLNENDVKTSSLLENTAQEHALSEDQETYSLAEDVGILLHTENVAGDKPLPDDVHERNLPKENLPGNCVRDDDAPRKQWMTEDAFGQLSLAENIPDTYSLTNKVVQKQPPTRLEAFSREKLCADDALHTHTSSGNDPEIVLQASDDEQKPCATDEDLPFPHPSELEEKLRGRLLPLVEGMYPGLGMEISQILLSVNPRDLHVLMTSTEALRVKAGEAVAMIQAHRAQQQLLQQQALYMQQQKQMLGQRLFALIQPAYPKLVGKITGMLMERESWELLQMLQWPQLLAARVEEAVHTLKNHLVKMPLTADVLDLFPAPMQKQMLAEKLHPLVQNYRPDQAASVTSMLLSLDNWKLLHVVENEDVLKATVDNVVSMLPQPGPGEGSKSVEREENDQLSAQNGKGKDIDKPYGEAGDDNKQREDDLPDKGAVHINADAAADLSSNDSNTATDPKQADVALEVKKDHARQLDTNLMFLAETGYPCTGAERTQANSLQEPDDLRSSFEKRGDSANSQTPRDSLKTLEDTAPEARDSQTSSKGEEPSTQGEDLRRAAGEGCAAQGGAVHLTQGDLMQYGMLVQQGVATPDVFDAVAHLQKQKQMLGERLFLLIQPAYPKLAAQITGLLTERDCGDLLYMLQWPQLLNLRVEEAVRTLQIQLLKGPLTAELLDLFPPQQQKQILGDRLFDQVESLQPVLAGKITGMLLGLDEAEVLHVLNDPQALKNRVEEAVAVLAACQHHDLNNTREGTPSVLHTALDPQRENNITTENEQNIFSPYEEESAVGKRTGSGDEWHSD